MSDQAKYYDYYIVEGPDVAALISRYEDIEKQRKEILVSAIEKVGAIAWTNNSGWGEKGDLLRSFVWGKDFSFPAPVTIQREDYFDGKRVVIARGKGNSKDGREYNKLLESVKNDANSKLKELPIWQSYIINHYGVMRTGIGGPAGNSGHRFAMLSTYGGKHPKKDDALLFAIPNNKDEKGHGKIDIPEGFQKLTYGQFYDITNEK